MKAIITFFLMMGLLCSIEAQNPCDTNSIFPFAALQITDIEGNCYDAATLSLPTFSNQPIPSGTAGRFLELNTGIYRAGIFILYFDDILDTLDGNNFNFYPNNNNATALALGLSRIELVCRVYEDLSYLLNQNPWGLANDKCVRIKVKKSTTGMMSSTLAEGGTFFVEMNIPQFAHGMVAKTIISGQDAWLNLNNYNPLWGNMPHGTLQVNFGGAIDYDIWANATLSVGKTHKLYSIILHEAVHSLGFSSAINANGWSTLANIGIPLVFNRFDNFLTKNGVPFPPRTTDVNGNIISVSAADTTGINCNNILFQGTNNSNQNIYTGSSFVSGTSLSHFGCTLSGTNYVMQGGTSMTSYNMRFDTAEVNTLCDLGYTTTTVFGQDTITNDSSANTFAYYPACASCVVIGNHDILNVSGQPFEICRDGGALPCTTPNVLNISINYILSNDTAYGNTATGVDTFGILAGGGSVSWNGTTMTYIADSTFGGWAILYYIPNNGICSGNPTYILVNVHAPANVCTPNSPVSCNLVCNGDFENYKELVSQIHPQSIVTQFNRVFVGYFPNPAPYAAALFYNPSGYPLGHLKAYSCDVSLANTNMPLNVNNSTVFWGTTANGCNAGGAIHLPLNKPLEIGKQYRIKVRVATTCPTSTLFAVFCENPPLGNLSITNDIRTYFPPAFSSAQAYDETDLPCVVTVPPPTNVGNFNNTIAARETIKMPFPQTSTFTQTSVEFNWVTVEDTFMVASNNLDNLIVHKGHNNGSYWHLIDDIEIYEIGTNQYDISSPADTIIVCAGDTITIPYIVNAELTNADTVNINLNASIQGAFSGMSFSDTGDFNNLGELDSVLVLAPGTVDTVLLNVIVPMSGTLGTINLISTPLDTNSCLGINSAPTISTTILSTGIILGNANICSGASTTLTAFGGGTYLWNTGQTTNSIVVTPSITTTYSVTVSSVLGCAGTSQITVIVKPLPIPSISGNLSICFGSNAILSATGGQSYIWSNGAATQNVNFIPFITSPITVTATASNGCTATASATITVNPIPTASITGTAVICNGASTVLTASGGTTYNWNTGATTANITVSPLVNTAYTVTVTSAAGCTTTTSKTVTVNPLPIVSSVATNILCNGGNTGAIDITASGGAPNYNYDWGVTTNEDISNLAVGIYTVTVTDANGCTATNTTIITEPTAITITANSTNILCNGANTGAIDITANGGEIPYTYVWNDGTTTKDRTGLAAGAYQVTITDDNGCTTTQSITLIEPTVLSATNAPTHILCNGANTGAIDITASGGATPYTYLWNDGTTTNNRTGLVAGTYQVTITDNNGCTTTQSITLTEPTVLSVNNVPTHVLCNGANTGEIDITANGGTTPYTYLWNDGSSTEDRMGLIAGIYQATITDNNGCTTTQSITLTEPSILSATNVPTHVLCNGANTGEIDITASGGTIPYAYLWNDGTITKDRTGLIAGTYQVTITDNNGCITTQNITITEPSALSVTIAQGVIPCGAAATGTATITVSGGVGGYTYLWDNNANNQTSSTATGLTAGTYQATVTDANGCTISANVVLVGNALPTVSIISNNITICEGESTDLTATGATTFQWSTGQNGTVISVSPQATTSYSVTGTDNNGCENTATTLVNVIPTLTLSFSQEVIPIPNTNTVEIRQTVCATGIGSVYYSLENIVPQGWQPSQPTINDFIVAGDCNITSFVLQLMDNADLCNIGVVTQATLIPQSSCITVIQDYLPINTAYIQLPTLIPPTITTFTQAISLPDPLLVSGNSQSIVFQGNITQDQGAFVFAGGSEIQLCPSVQLSVATNADLRMFSTYAHATAFPGQLWRSITVEPGGSLLVTRDITHPSTMLIEDALYGIEVLSNATANATVRVQKAIFNRNHVGIYAPQQPQANASNILLEANTFDCSSALLPAPWATQAIDNWSFAGVEVNNFLFLNVLDGNTFRNLTNGIVAKSSDVTVTRSWFKHIQPRTFYTNQQMPSGNGIYIESPRERVVHQLFQKGWGASANDLATFENCYNGIVGIRTKMQVESNRMTGVGRWGICSQLAISAQSVWIYRNRIEVPNYSKAIAINLLQNTSKVQVHDNVLLVGLMTANNEAAGGILVNNQGASQDLHIMRNMIELYKGGAGISLTSVSALAPNVVNVSANTIDFRLSAQGQPNNQNAIHRNGIVANNCFGVELSCNTITSNLSMAGGGLSTPNNPNIFRNAIGINVNNSVVRVNCNTMFRTDTGLRFWGTCNGTEVRANSFKMHRIGLLYEANTNVGDQEYMGNLWYGNFPTQNSGGGAVNYGAITNNEYSVSNTPLPPLGAQYMPPNATPLWFSPLSNGTQESCNITPCPVNFPLLSLSILNSTDIGIVNNQIPQNPVALPWGLRKGLYHKLDKNPILRLNSAMGQFYNTYQTQPIAAVVAATDAQENVIAVDSPILAQSQQYYDNMAILLDSIGVVDSLYVEGQNSNQSWQMQRTAYLQQYAQMVQNQVSVVSFVLSQIAVQNQQAQSINTNIIPSNTPEQNERVVNEIYLQTVAMGDNVFSAMQKQTLYDIAHQCPELGGNAVYRARSIYALVEHGDYNTNCNYLPQTRMASLDTCHEDVNFPNPSLEGTPGFNAAPNGWVICESTPDIHPHTQQLPPSDSFTYVGQGAVTFFAVEESFGCQLQDSVVKGKRYKFSFDVAKGQAQTLGAFSMWLGNTPCSKEQMIHWGITYDNVWNKRFVEFIPNESYLYFIISAEIYHPVENYNIIDNLRPVVCDTMDTVVTPPIDTFHIAPYHEHTEYEEDILVGMEEINIERFNIYPNPNMQGQLTVEWGSPLPPSKIVLLDALGRRVGQYYTLTGETMQVIDIHLLASGYYTVVLQNDRQVFARGKLIIAKP